MGLPNEFRILDYRYREWYRWYEHDLFFSFRNFRFNLQILHYLDDSTNLPKYKWVAAQYLATHVRCSIINITVCLLQWKSPRHCHVNTRLPRCNLCKRKWVAGKITLDITTIVYRIS